MGKLLAARFVRLLATVFAVSFLTFMLTNLLPGDAINALIPIDAQQDPEYVAQLREDFGLNDPLIVRFFDWFGNAITGDLGKSLVSGQPVMDEITHRLPVTLELAFVSIIIALVFAVPLGVLSAYREGTRTDQGISALSQVLLSVPNFVVGLVLIYVFAMRLQWLPATG